VHISLDNASFAYLNIKLQKTCNIFFSHLNVGNRLGKFHCDIC